MDIIRLSISEAAKLFGVSAQTIRRAIKDQAIGYVVVRGRYRLNFESVLKWSQGKTTVRKKRDQRGVGQYVNQWKISNTLYSPNPKALKRDPNNPNTSESTKEE